MRALFIQLSTLYPLVPAADTQTVERRGKVAKAIIFPAKRIVLAMVGGLGILSRERRHALGDETGLMFHSGGFKPDRGGLSFMRSSDKNGRRFSPVLLVGEDILKVNHPFCALPARKTYASRTTCDTFRREQEFGSSQGSGCTRTAWRRSDSFHVDGRFLLSKGRLRARLAGPSARDVFDRRHMVHSG